MNSIKRFITWFSNTFKKQGKIGKVIVVIILCFLCSIPIAILNPSSPVPENTKISDTLTGITEVPEIPTATILPVVTIDPIEQLKIMVSDILGKSNRDVPRVSSVSWESDLSEIWVTFAGQDNLTDDLIRRSVQMDIVKILNTIQASDTSIPYKSIVAVATFPLVDVYGNSKETNVVIATYLRENLDKVNWDNFLTDDVYLISEQDYLFIHTAFR